MTLDTSKLIADRRKNAHTCDEHVKTIAMSPLLTPLVVTPVMMSFTGRTGPIVLVLVAKESNVVIGNASHGQWTTRTPTDGSETFPAAETELFVKSDIAKTNQHAHTWDTGWNGVSVPNLVETTVCRPGHECARTTEKRSLAQISSLMDTVRNANVAEENARASLSGQSGRSALKLAVNEMATRKWCVRACLATKATSVATATIQTTIPTLCALTAKVSFDTRDATQTFTARTGLRGRRGLCAKSSMVSVITEG